VFFSTTPGGHKGTPLQASGCQIEFSIKAEKEDQAKIGVVSSACRQWSSQASNASIWLTRNWLTSQGYAWGSASAGTCVSCLVNHCRHTVRCCSSKRSATVSPSWRRRGAGGCPRPRGRAWPARSPDRRGRGRARPECCCLRQCPTTQTPPRGRCATFNG